MKSTHKAQHLQKNLKRSSSLTKPAILIALGILSGCGQGEWFLMPDQQDLKFKCDMDQLRQGCEREQDYEQHFKSLKTKQAS